MLERRDGGDQASSDTATSRSLGSTDSESAREIFDAAMFITFNNTQSALSTSVGLELSKREPVSSTSPNIRPDTSDYNDSPKEQNNKSAWQLEGQKKPDKFAHHARVVQQSTETKVRLQACLLKRNERLSELFVMPRGARARPLYSVLNAEVEALCSQPVVAPVTKNSLKELELPAIQNNLALRIDLCFDHELFFQRISGSKGEEKQRKAKEFWEILSLELQSYAHALHHPSPEDCRDCRDAQGHSISIESRLVAFFSAFKELLEMLVPDSDKQDVLQRVDVEWLTKRVRMGVFDAATFADWLLKLLMSHCAPMRDESAREMHSKITRGAELNDMGLLVDGLETLMSLLENMKLDVANHQVRSFKLLLIADTVPFLRDCFSKLINGRQLDFSSSQAWFRKLRSHTDIPERSDFDFFTCGLVNLCTSPSASFPQTFAYDTDRLQVLQDDVFDFLHLRICMRFYKTLVYKQTGVNPTVSQREEFAQRVLQLVSFEDGHSDRVLNHLDAIALEIARVVTDTSSNTTSSGTAQHIDHDLIQTTASGLWTALEQQQHEELASVSKLLTTRTLHHTTHFSQLDTLHISNLQRTWSMNRSSKGMLLAPDLDDIARRLAHVAVIHWKVWSDLVYLDDSESGSGFPGSSSDCQMHPAKLDDFSTQSKIRT